MKPDNSPVPVYLNAVSAVGEVGCLLTIVVMGSLFLGLVVDRILNTNHLFLFVLLLASIPLNLWLIYRYTVYKSRRLQALSKKEEPASDVDKLER
jgi:hypothetical protein